MSTVAVSAGSPGASDARRPGYGLLLRRVLSSQVCGTVWLWVAVSAFRWLSLVRVNVSGLSIYGPWIVHGPWISAQVTLTRCPPTPVTLTAMRVSYREFGVSLSQTVPLDDSTTVQAWA